MEEKHIRRFRRIKFEIMRNKPKGDLFKVSLENMHIRRRSMGLKMSVINIENDLREGREGEVSNIVNGFENECHRHRE